jgi:hypothetical protein
VVLPKGMHRSCQPISELAQAIGVLARTQQDAVRHRNRIANELRTLLREFYPGFLAAFVNRTWGLPYALATLSCPAGSATGTGRPTPGTLSTARPPVPRSSPSPNC